jgi:DNA polymerase I
MGLFADMSARGLRTSYDKYVVEMERILAAGSLRGMPVSPAQHASVAAQLDAQATAQLELIQTLVPDEVKQLTKWKKKPNVRLPFKPSNPALIRYMKFRGHEVPRHFRTKKQTTGEDELARLAKKTGDPLYSAVIDYRDAKTVRTNHVKNWQPSPDGRVHATFYFTATGQLEARRPSLMNAPHHKESGRLFRSIVEARPGHKILSFDYKGFHGLYLAHLSGDPTMRRVAGMDIVSFATAHLLQLPKVDEALSWDDDSLRDWLSWVKKNYKQIRDAKMKHAFHGYDNGMQPYGCYMRYRDFFDSKREVTRILGLLDRLFPVALAYRNAQVEIAHDQGFLINQFGRLRYFWEVKRWCGGEWSHGDDAEAAISFQQQSSAHCHLQDVMLTLEKPIDYLARAGFCTPIHDDLTFECPDDRLDECRAYIQPIMEAPSPVTGLAVAVEPKVGQRWNEMRVLETAPVKEVGS